MRNTPTLPTMIAITGIISVILFGCGRHSPKDEHSNEPNHLAIETSDGQQLSDLKAMAHNSINSLRRAIDSVIADKGENSHLLKAKAKMNEALGLMLTAEACTDKACMIEAVSRIAFTTQSVRDSLHKAYLEVGAFRSIATTRLNMHFGILESSIKRIIDASTSMPELSDPTRAMPPSPTEDPQDDPAADGSSDEHQDGATIHTGQPGSIPPSSDDEGRGDEVPVQDSASAPPAQNPTEGGLSNDDPAANDSGITGIQREVSIGGGDSTPRDGSSSDQHQDAGHEADADVDAPSDQDHVHIGDTPSSPQNDTSSDSWDELLTIKVVCKDGNCPYDAEGNLIFGGERNYDGGEITMGYASADAIGITAAGSQAFHPKMKQSYLSFDLSQLKARLEGRTIDSATLMLTPTTSGQSNSMILATVFMDNNVTGHVGVDGVSDTEYLATAGSLDSWQAGTPKAIDVTRHLNRILPKLDEALPKTDRIAFKLSATLNAPFNPTIVPFSFKASEQGPATAPRLVIRLR